MRFDLGLTPKPTGLGQYKAAFSTKDDGNMVRSQSNRMEIAHNRDKFLSSNIPADRVVMRIRPSHSPNIEIAARAPGRISQDTYLFRPLVYADFDFYEEGCDGILTRDENLAVTLISGDCVPVLVWNLEAKVFGIIHVGLLGTLNAMAGNLEEPLRALGADISETRFYLGPSIGPEDYDIGQSGLWGGIEEQVRSKVHVMEPMGRHLIDGRLFDMRSMIAEQLEGIGANPDNIEAFHSSTASKESQFYSHYGANRTGDAPCGFYSAIWL